MTDTDVAEVKQVKPKRTGVVVLAVVATLLLGTSVTFGVLYARKNNEHAQDVTRLTDMLRKAEEASVKASDERSLIQGQMDASSMCTDIARQYLKAALAGERESTGLLMRMHQVC